MAAEDSEEEALEVDKKPQTAETAGNLELLQESPSDVDTSIRKACGCQGHLGCRCV